MKKMKQTIKKMKPIVKKSDDQNITEWIIGEFPESYQNMIYIDVMCRDLNIMLAKERSKLEILNDTHEGIIQVYRAIRDENKDFSKKISNVRCTETTFQKYLENQNLKFDDYLDKAVNEFVLRKLSKSENKEVFSNKKVEWKKVLQEVNELHKRLQETFIMNKEAIEVVQKFNHNDSVLYYALPTGHKDQFYTKLANTFKNFSGHAIISCSDHKIFKLFFPDWKLKRKMFQKLNKKRIQYIWKNY
jgi:DNA adenine methylase